MILSSLFPHTASRTFRALTAALALCLCAAGAPRAQQSPQDDDPVERVNTSLVLLNVGVADRRGRAVTDLTRGDFAVYEDGVKQNIVNFEPAASPFSLVLLLDMSGSTRNFRPTLKQSALRFLDALGPEDRVAVISFSKEIKTLSGFTTDRRNTAFAITELADGRGETSFYGALRYSLKQLAGEGKRRKAVIVLSDGLDTELSAQDRKTTSSAATPEEAVATVKPDEAAPLRTVLDSADRQGVTIYPLALPSGDPKRLLPLTPQQAAVYAAARARMNTLANRTGGRLHQINRLEDMGRLYAEVAADMRALYSIAYQSSNPRPRDGSWRAISVEVTRADTIARSRPGYYAR
ncbi:MAG TPA: VWA domain-containing protein [Pyrinomonadaceae bacterium]|nr:VWA domain-containing protein [Pyrinomonadaceae bacterium]